MLLTGVPGRQTVSARHQADRDCLVLAKSREHGRSTCLATNSSLTEKAPPVIGPHRFREVLNTPDFAREFFFPLSIALWEDDRFHLGKNEPEQAGSGISGVRLHAREGASQEIIRDCQTDMKKPGPVGDSAPQSPRTLRCRSVCRAICSRSPFGYVQRQTQSSLDFIVRVTDGSATKFLPQPNATSKLFALCTGLAFLSRNQGIFNLIPASAACWTGREIWN